MAQFVLNNGHLGPSYGRKRRSGVPEDTLLLFDLAMEWNSFTMWAAVLNNSGSDKDPQLLGSAPLIRAWKGFPFDLTRPMLVPSHLLLPRCIPCTHVSHFKRFSQIRKAHPLPT